MRYPIGREPTMRLPVSHAAQRGGAWRFAQAVRLAVAGRTNCATQTPSLSHRCRMERMPNAACGLERAAWLPLSRSWRTRPRHALASTGRGLRFGVAVAIATAGCGAAGGLSEKQAEQVAYRDLRSLGHVLQRQCHLRRPPTATLLDCTRRSAAWTCSFAFPSGANGTLNIRNSSQRDDIVVNGGC